MRVMALFQHFLQNARVLVRMAPVRGHLCHGHFSSYCLELALCDDKLFTYTVLGMTSSVHIMHIIVVGFYGFTFVLRVSVCLSACCRSLGLYFLFIDD